MLTIWHDALHTQHTHAHTDIYSIHGGSKYYNMWETSIVSEMWIF